MSDDPYREATWYGVFIPSTEPDRSGGTNDRYGQACPLKNKTINEDRFSDLKVGDIVLLLCPRGYGHHSAGIRITKMNRKTFKGIEIPHSYRPGVNWSVGINSALQISLEYTSLDRLEELAKKWN
jgi:hypothetical protein